MLQPEQHGGSGSGEPPADIPWSAAAVFIVAILAVVGLAALAIIRVT